MWRTGAPGVHSRILLGLREYHGCVGNVAHGYSQLSRTMPVKIIGIQPACSAPRNNEFARQRAAVIEIGGIERDHEQKEPADGGGRRRGNKKKMHSLEPPCKYLLVERVALSKNSQWLPPLPPSASISFSPTSFPLLAFFTLY